MHVKHRFLRSRCNNILFQHKSSQLSGMECREAISFKHSNRDKKTLQKWDVQDVCLGAFFCSAFFFSGKVYNFLPHGLWRGFITHLNMIWVDCLQFWKRWWNWCHVAWRSGINTPYFIGCNRLSSILCKQTYNLVVLPNLFLSGSATIAFDICLVWGRLYYLRLNNAFLFQQRPSVWPLCMQ